METGSSAAQSQAVPDPSPAAGQVAAVRCTGLRKCYRDGSGAHRVLEGIELAVAAGECLALLGRSGSGKSTLLNLLAGIERPDGGRIEILGQDLSGLGEPGVTLLRRRSIGFVYQLFNLIPTLTVAENVALPLDLLGRLPAPPRGRRPGRPVDPDPVGALVDRLGLGGRAQAFPDRLSGGEQQRVALARALIHSPALVLADEPTGNLDAETGALVLDLLVQLVRERGAALVLVTHSLAVARIADRVLTLDGGRLRDWGPGPGLAW
jgi:putative ABC transport system ATP-binding protein